MNRTLSHVHRIDTDFGAMYWLIDYSPNGKVVNAMIAHRRLNEDQAVTKLVEQLSSSLAEALADISQPASKAE
jgi:hypothetical protein